MKTKFLALKAFQPTEFSGAVRGRMLRKFWLWRRPLITLVTLSGRRDSIFCCMIMNEVTFFRGINFLSDGINKNTSKYIREKLRRVEVSRKQTFDQIIVINHPRSETIIDRAFLIVACKS